MNTKKRQEKKGCENIKIPPIGSLTKMSEEELINSDIFNKKPKMKLCFIASGSIHTRRWVEYFAKRHEVHVILNKKAEYEGCKTYYVGGNPIVKAFKIMNLVNKINPDVIHAHQVTPFGLYGRLSHGNKPFVVTAWGYDIFGVPKKSKFMKLLTENVLKHADLITCDGKNIEFEMFKLGADPRKIKLILFGTDTEKFKPNNVIFKDNPCTIISLRSLEPIYNVETLIRAVPEVLNKFPETKFIVCGKGSEENRLREIAKELKVTDNIYFIGSVENKELPYYINTSSIYVSTSLADAGLSASTAEAMACGLPAIVTDFGVNKEWVKDGVNGFLFPMKDSKTLAEKIIYLLENPEKRKEFGKNGRDLIVEKLNYEIEMNKMEELYKGMIK